MSEQTTNKTTIIAKICLRQGDNTYCNQFNEEKLLLVGEPIFNTETKVLKIGDGETAYNLLESYYLGTEIDNMSYNNGVLTITKKSSGKTGEQTNFTVNINNISKEQLNSNLQSEITNKYALPSDGIPTAHIADGAVTMIKLASGVTNVIASSYSASATYNRGDFILYDSALYRAKQDIATAEPWTETHWESVSVGEALQQLQTAISAPETYAQLQALVRSGLAHLSVKAGDQIVGKVDGSDRDFDVLGIDEDCPVDTPTKHVLSLQMHDIWTALTYLYDYSQYLYAVTEEKFPSGMGPGIYTFKLDHAVNRTAYATAEDGYYSFVIPQGYSVPVGGGIRHTVMGSEASENAYSPSRILGGDFICYGVDRVTKITGLNALTTFAALTFAEGSALRGEINADTFYAKVGAAGGRYTFYYDAVAGRWMNFETASDVDLSEYGITLTGQPSDQEEIVVTLGKMLGTTTAKNPLYLSSNEPINYTSRQFYGSNRWKTSFARQFLNSDASPMVFDYTQAGAFGRPPAIMPNAGFLSQLDPDLKSVLCKITKRYARCAADGGGYEDVDDKVTLCTLLDCDLGANYGVYEGAVDENGRLKRQSAHTLWKDSQQADRIKYYNGTARGWYLSSCRPEGSATMNVFVSSGGTGDAQASGAYGLVPCIFIG